MIDDEDAQLVINIDPSDTEVIKDLTTLIEEVNESEPEESKKLRKGLRSLTAEDPTQMTVNAALKSSNSSKLTKEVRCELAVIAVKRAFSQCPNLTLLVSTCWGLCVQD